MRKLLVLTLFVASAASAQFIEHPPDRTIAQLGACNAARDGRLVSITNGSAKDNDCSTTGSDTKTCRCDGSTWLPVEWVPPHCWQAADPATDDEWYSIWYTDVAVTIESIYCEVTGGTSVALDLEIDDGAITGVNGSNITCTTSGVLDSTLAGDTAMAATNKMDVDMGTVTGTVTQVVVCFTMTRP